MRSGTREKGLQVIDNDGQDLFSIAGTAWESGRRRSRFRREADYGRLIYDGCADEPGKEERRRACPQGLDDLLGGCRGPGFRAGRGCLLVGLSHMGHTKQASRSSVPFCAKRESRIH